MSDTVSKLRNDYDSTQKRKLVELGNSNKSYRDILSYLENEIKLSKKMADFRHPVFGFKDDCVYQLNKAIELIYGVAAGINEEKPSGGVQNLQMIDVILADGTRKKVPYGKIDLPEMGDGAHIDIAYDPKSNTLFVTGSCQFRYNTMIDEIVEKTRWFLNHESIYKDQAIELDAAFNPKVLNLSNIDKEFMVLSKTIEYQLRPLYARIQNPLQCIAKGIPLKTGILMEGPYGTGKTLLAFKIAQKAIANGWCFIYLKDPTLLAKTLKLSKSLDNNGHGVIVFLEDIDQVTRGERNQAMQDILNTIDGGDTKQMNVIALFTTNHLELIDPTFLRGKRIGSIVSMGALDEKTTREFLDYTFKGDYDLDTTGIDEVCKKIAEHNIVPAFMAEITEKVKANLVFEDSNKVTADMLHASLAAYLRQVSLSQKKDLTQSAAEVLYQAMRGVTAAAIPEMAKQVEEIHTEVVE